MKVKTLINRLLNYDMDIDVELVMYGDNEERFSCTLKDDCIEEEQCLDYCAIILHSNELKDDDDESIQDLILYKHCLINSKKNKLKKKESNDKRG
jgi:hypothetical protein